MRILNFSDGSILKAVALIIGFIPALFFLIFLVGEAVGQLMDGGIAVIPLLVLMLITVSGYILAWKKTRVGGIVMLSGGLLMAVYLLFLSGSDGFFPAFCFAFPFILTACIMLMVRSLG